MAEIWAFIAEGSPPTATAFIHRIEEKFEPLRHHPELGPQRGQLAPGLRAHFNRDYVIYYSFMDPTSGALWYHADYVKPSWRNAFERGPKIGRHIFYSQATQKTRVSRK